MSTPREPLPLGNGRAIAWSELRFERSRSSGPGGQNVNKVESRITLRWTPALTRAVNERQRAWLCERLASRLNAAGELVLHSDEHREASRNQSAACWRLVELVRAALVRPKVRTATKPGAGAVRRRLQAKRRSSERKRDRRAVGDGD
ncbi:MAG: aminoacyl-tRNA hydrolase [Planctomycetota bacterium]|nr:MAG: aminoacyl-tRNA hydrolase [Planctomycetota bacterium]